MAIKNRYEFMGFLACSYANPNGDPDAGNLPRVDPQTMKGYMSDVCIKRRIRDYINAAYGDKPGMEIFVQNGINLNKNIALAKEAAGVKLDSVDKTSVYAARDKACEKFWDVRAMGAVMSTGPNAGQVRGPLQVMFAESVDPVYPMDIGIARVAVADSLKGKKMATASDYQAEEDKTDADKMHTLGRKQLIPFGLYVIKGFISANFAEETKFSEEDLAALWDALANMWEHSRTSSKGMMSMVGPLVIFRHDGLGNRPDDIARSAKLGCAPAYKLFDLVQVQRKPGVEYPRSHKDYECHINLSALPAGVSVGFGQGCGAGVSWGVLPAGEDWMTVV